MDLTRPQYPQADLRANITRLKELVQQSHSFLLTSTARADGDSIASQLALLRFIKAVNPRAHVDIINETPCPDIYTFLEGSQQVKSLAQAQPLPAYDMGLVTDCGPDRIGKVAPIFATCRLQIVVDHHRVQPQNHCDIQLVDPRASSTVELLYAFLQAWGLTLDQPLAEILYLGMIFDTGGFQFPLTTPLTLRIAAELIATGIDFSKICERILLVRSFASRRLLGEVLVNLQRDPTGRICWGGITQAMVQRLGTQPEDQEGIVNYLSFTQGVQVGVLFIQEGAQQWRLSLRSRGQISVALLAQQLNPQGGGHDRAAGCRLSGSYEQVQQKTLQAIATMLDQAATCKSS